MPACAWLTVAASVLLTLSSGCAAPGARPARPGPAQFNVAVPVNDEGWQTTVTPYVWAMGMDGDVTVKGAKAQLDVSFTDLIGALDYGGQVHVETRRGDWGFFFSGSFFALSEDGDLGPIGLEADIKAGGGEAGVMRKVAEWQTDAGRPAELDLLAGIRYTSVDETLDLDAPGPLELGTKVTGEATGVGLIPSTALATSVPSPSPRA